MLSELKIELISVRHSILHQLLSVLSRRLDAFGLADDDVRVDKADPASTRNGQ